MKTRTSYALVFPLSLLLTACGGSSGTDSTASAATSENDKSQSNNFGFGKTAPELAKIIDKIEIDETPEMRSAVSYQKVDGTGIIFEFTKYVIDELGGSSIFVRIDNGSPKTLTDIHCAISAWKDDKQIDTIDLNYSSMSVDPGESGMEEAELNPYKRTGFKDFDKMSLDFCNHTAFDREKLDVVSGPVKVEFVEFGDTRAELTLSLTNNKPHTIGYANCVYDAKIGDVIVDLADLDFRGAINKNGSYIEPGETVERTTRFYDTKAINDFDSTFDYENLNCSYKDIK